MNIDEIQVRISESSDNSSHLPILARNAPVTPSLGKNILSPEDLSEMRKNNDIGENSTNDDNIVECYYDYIAKVLFIGEHGVGKSTLISVYQDRIQSNINKSKSNRSKI